MPRGGKRDGAGRRQLQAESAGLAAPKKAFATEILESLGKDIGHEKDCLCEKCLWRKDAQQPGAAGRPAREYLWDRRDGKTISNVNHIHDKPIEMNVNVKLSEIIRQIRERKRDYERNRG